MKDNELAVLMAAMDMAAAQHALDLGTPAQAHLARTKAVLMDACSDLAADHEGEWSPEMSGQNDILNRASIRLALAVAEIKRLGTKEDGLDRHANGIDAALIAELQAARC